MTTYDQWRLAGPPEPIKVGDEEGDDCNRRGCKGTMGFDPVENCSCHISPPSNPLICDTCGHGPDDEPTGPDDDFAYEQHRDRQMENDRD